MTNHTCYQPKVGNEFTVILKRTAKSVRGGVMLCTKVVRGNYVLATDNDGQKRVFKNASFSFTRFKKNGIAKK